jgi:hypothetical protein
MKGADIVNPTFGACGVNAFPSFAGIAETTVLETGTTAIS